jgi:hypothetical protein
MTQEIAPPDPPLSAEQAAKVAELSDAQLLSIDKWLMSGATAHWRKVAMLVGFAMTKDPDRVPGIPDLFYGQRVRKLVSDGHLESDGNLAYMSYSEVRLPNRKSSHET